MDTVTKDNAKELAICYSAYNQANDRFFDSHFQKGLSSLRVWAKALKKEQNEAECYLVDPEILEYWIERK